MVVGRRLAFPFGVKRPIFRHYVSFRDCALNCYLILERWKEVLSSFLTAARSETDDSQAHESVTKVPLKKQLISWIDHRISNDSGTSNPTSRVWSRRLGPDLDDSEWKKNTNNENVSGKTSSLACKDIRLNTNSHTYHEAFWVSKLSKLNYCRECTGVLVGWAVHAKAAFQLGGFRFHWEPTMRNFFGFFAVLTVVSQQKMMNKTLKPHEFGRNFGLLTWNTSTKKTKTYLYYSSDVLKPSVTKVLSGTMKATKLRHLNLETCLGAPYQHHGDGDWVGWLVGFCWSTLTDFMVSQFVLMFFFFLQEEKRSGYKICSKSYKLQVATWYQYLLEL